MNVRKVLFKYFHLSILFFKFDIFFQKGGNSSVNHSPQPSTAKACDETTKDADASSDTRVSPDNFFYKHNITSGVLSLNLCVSELLQMFNSVVISSSLRIERV